MGISDAGAGEMRHFVRQRSRWIWMVGVTIIVGAAIAGADEIVLRGGGRVQGKVLPDPKNPEKVRVLLMQGRTPLSLERPQILKVVPRESPLDEYTKRLEALSATAEAEYELGVWCEQQRLGDLARLHFEGALIHDPNFAPARKKLNHVAWGDRWLTPDELRRVQGLVKYKGRWITEDERERLEQLEQTTSSQTSWIRRIQALRQSIVAGTSDRSREAEIDLLRIQDEDAVIPLVRVLGNDDLPLRKLLAHALKGIPGKAAAKALAWAILSEEEDGTRAVFLEALRERDDPDALPVLVRALGSGDVKVINRAAWALGHLDARSAVPRLVDALVTTEERIVIVNPESNTPIPPAVDGLSPAMIAFNGSTIGYLTPPAVGPGVVAYGATSVPFYNPAQLRGGPLLGVGSGPNRGPVPRTVTLAYQNTEVLAALKKLTGENFGYDVQRWKEWIRAEFNPDPQPARRVPQP
jgi:HEAT repeat protein